MVNRNAFDETIEKLKKVYSHHEGLEFEKSLKPIVDFRNNFDIKLMMIGHFSAGKSSLLNMLIGRPDFLKVAQEPQTAIATELVYDENESAYAYDEEGKREVINPQKEYSVQNYNHLEYRICSENLKKIRDFTIVDTPGFDAGIEAHAKALAGYIGVGSAYIVVIDQEKGGIDETTLEFIREISGYSSQIAVLINKCDKVTAETAERIAESARSTLGRYGFNYKVYTVSTWNPDISEKLVDIISSFDAQAAFDKVMRRRLKSELISTEKILSVVQKKIFLDTYDLDAEIRLYSRLEEQLSGTFEMKEKEAKEELDNTVQNVSDKVESVLISRADSVVGELLNGNQVAAEAVILETVRPIMLSEMRGISIGQIDSVAASLNTFGWGNEIEGLDLSKVTDTIADNIKDIINEGTFETKNAAKKSRDLKNKDRYHEITGVLAAVTDVCTPWIEVIIIALPEVINFLRGIFGESDAAAAKRSFIENGVPQIMNKMYPQIKQNVETTTKIVRDEYEKLITEKIDSIRMSISEAQNKKKEKVQEFEQYKAHISEDIVIVKNMIGELG